MVGVALELCPDYFDQLGVFEAWKFSSGEGVQAIIVDSCIDDSHQAFLNTKIYPPKVNIDKNDDCRVIQPTLSNDAIENKQNNIRYFHGTTVASTVIAKPSSFPLHNEPLNNIKVCGIAPQANLYSINLAKGNDMHDALDESFDFSTSTIKTAKGKEVFKTHDRLAIVASLSAVHTEGKITKDTWQSFLKGACKKDFYLAVVAVGNGNVKLSDHPNQYYPANVKLPSQCSHDPLIRVGSLNKDSSLKAEHSNYGDNVDILVRGEELHTAYPGDRADLSTGTSYAAPIVSGTIALLLKCNPFAKASQIRDTIIENADKYESLKNYAKDGRVLNITASVIAFCTKKSEEL